MVHRGAAWPRALRIWILGFVALAPFITGTSLLISFIEHPSSHHIYEYILLFVGVSVIIFIQTVVAILPTAPFGVIALILTNSNNRIIRYVLPTLVIGLASLASAYLFDYGIPNYRFYSDDRPDWEHGLTSTRYLVALSAQSFVFLVGLTVSTYARLRTRRHSN